MNELKETFEETLEHFSSQASPLEPGNGVISAVITSDYIEIDIGGGNKKAINLVDFKTLLGEVLGDDEEEEEVIKGMLPPSNMIFYSKSATKISITCYYPGGIRNLKFQNESKVIEEFPIIVPNIIISHTLVKDNSGEDFIINGYSRYYCTNLPVSKLPTTFISAIDNANGIFLLPMSNTYESGNMCYGNNFMPARFRDFNFRGLDYYYKFMWETPFNSDLGVKALNRECKFNTPSKWYKHLGEIAKTPNPEFPYSELRGFPKPEIAPVAEAQVGDDPMMEEGEVNMEALTDFNDETDNQA